MDLRKIRIGISGWTYPDWRGVFYPESLAIKNELTYASHTFNSIEVNGTFYALQKPHTFEKWYAETPDGFRFAIKAPKYVTHERRLKDVETPIANFLASGLLALKEKLGPILWQLPPSLPLNLERIEAFLKLLPHTTKAASALAKKHSDWMKERAYTETDFDGPLLHALEVRHASFKTPEFIALMKKYRVAIVIGDTAGRWPLIEDLTSAMMYIRLHGDEILYPDGYTEPALQEWAKKIANFSQHTDVVYAFCDNDHKIAAPLNAMQLMGIMDFEWKLDVLPPNLLKKAAKKSEPATNNRAVAKTARRGRAKDKPLNKRRKVA